MMIKMTGCSGLRWQLSFWVWRLQQHLITASTFVASSFIASSFVISKAPLVLLQCTPHTPLLLLPHLHNIPHLIIKEYHITHSISHKSAHSL